MNIENLHPMKDLPKHQIHVNTLSIYKIKRDSCFIDVRYNLKVTSHDKVVSKLGRVNDFSISPLYNTT